MYNCYRVFPRGKERQGRAADPLPLLVLRRWKARATPPLPLWAVRPVQSLSACTRVTFTFTFLPIPSSNASSPYSAIQPFFFQFPISSSPLNVIQQLLTYSNSFSFHFYVYPSLYLAFNNVFQKVVPIQVVTNPVIFRFNLILCTIFLSYFRQYFFIRHTIDPTDIFHPSPAPHLRLPRFGWSTFRSVQVSATYKAIILFQT
jgi:hypothetical protein